MKVEKQLSKFIKPFDPTPATHSHYRLGFIDELSPPVYVGMVLFFSPDSNHNPKFVSELEKSLEKTLTRLYPLAGRYVDGMKTVECNDEGAQFIHAKVNIKLHDFLGLEENAELVDEFIPFKSGVPLVFSDPLLVIQVTMFECGGLAVGENVTEFIGSGFNSSLLFPPRYMRPIPPRGELPIAPTHKSDVTCGKFTCKKLSFSESAISNMKAKAIAGGKINTCNLSKVQLVSGIIWKALIGVDRAVHNITRESILLQPVNLRGEMASLIPKDSCGNFCSVYATSSGSAETTEELVHCVSDSTKKIKSNYKKVYHNTEEGQAMVLNSYLNIADVPESTNVIRLTSWCKFPFYEADFGPSGWLQG
ncbi:transferase, chloramphenicol acetyltransferase-like domain protein [Tanacetum coccineum]